MLRKVFLVAQETGVFGPLRALSLHWTGPKDGKRQVLHCGTAMCWQYCLEFCKFAEGVVLVAGTFSIAAPHRMPRRQDAVEVEAAERNCELRLTRQPRRSPRAPTYPFPVRHQLSPQPPSPPAI